MSLIQDMREKLADRAIAHYAKKERMAREREEKLAKKEAMLGMYRLCSMATCFGVMGLRMEQSEHELEFYDPYAGQSGKFNFAKLDDVAQNMNDLNDLLFDTFKRRQGYIKPGFVSNEIDLNLKLINYFYHEYCTDKAYFELLAGKNGTLNISGKTEIVRYDVDYPEKWTMAEMYKLAGSIFSHAQDNELPKITKKDFTRLVREVHSHNKDIFAKYHGFESDAL